MNRYFNVEVKPTIPALDQHSGDFAAGTILFNWTEFEIPKGGARLIGITAIVRGKDGADQGNDDISLVFAKSIDNVAPTNLGSVRSTVSSGGWTNNAIGHFHLDGDSETTLGKLVVAEVYTSATSTFTNAGMVMEGEPKSGSSVGYDKLYVAGLVRSVDGTSINFSTSVLARGGTTADGVAVEVPTDKGSDDDPDADLVFAPGDVIHTLANQPVGTVKSISAFDTDHQDLVFEDPIGPTISDNSELYIINPIKLILNFEK